MRPAGRGPPAPTPTGTPALVPTEPGKVAGKVGPRHPRLVRDPEAQGRSHAVSGRAQMRPLAVQSLPRGADGLRSSPAAGPGCSARPEVTAGCDFGFVLSACRVTAPTKNSSRWLLLAVGRTGLSDSFVRSFIKYILGAVARPGDQWGTLGLWWGAPLGARESWILGLGPCTACLRAV